MNQLDSLSPGQDTIEDIRSSFTGSNSDDGQTQKKK